MSYYDLIIDRTLRSYPESEDVALLATYLQHEAANGRKATADYSRSIQFVLSAAARTNAEIGARAKALKSERDKWRSVAKRYAKALNAAGLPLPAPTRVDV